MSLELFETAIQGSSSSSGTYHLSSASVLFNLEIAWRSAASLRRSPVRNRPRSQSHPMDLFLCIVDHFEPQHGRPSRQVAWERLEDWAERYPQIAGAHHDSEGRPPTHSFFYPWDEFDEREFVRLVEVCSAGWGEIELHLHHFNDSEEALRAKIREAVRVYREHGALSTWPDGRPAFSFIHGNWALNNSRFDRDRNYCGVNDEITLLQAEGCYADFTFPAWQHTAQPRQVNSIYYAQSFPDRSKGHDHGTEARVGSKNTPGLLLIQGPLVPFLGKGRLGLKLSMDDGDLASYRRYSPERLDRWVQAGIHIEDCPDRIFIKLHCHGAPDANRSALLGKDLDALFSDIERRYNDGVRYRLHYVTAREMFNVALATIKGAEWNPMDACDYLLPAPSAAGSPPGGKVETAGRRDKPGRGDEKENRRE
jgi:hypothetical protein